MLWPLICRQIQHSEPVWYLHPHRRPHLGHQARVKARVVIPVRRWPGFRTSNGAASLDWHPWLCSSFLKGALVLLPLWAQFFTSVLAPVSLVGTFDHEIPCTVNHPLAYRDTELDRWNRLGRWTDELSIIIFIFVNKGRFCLGVLIYFHMAGSSMFSLGN